MHPASLRCGSVEYTRYFALDAPCDPGASTLSMLTSLPGRDTSGFGEIKTQKSFLSDHLCGPTCQVLTAPEQADEGSRSDRREEA